MRPEYERTSGRDGYVSLEVSPALAHDAAGTIAAGLRLKAAVQRKNLLIKVPATAAGLKAIEELIFRAEHNRRTQDHGVRELFQDNGLAGGFSAAVVAR